MYKNFEQWLQIILDNSAIMRDGEAHPASDIYTVEDVDPEEYYQLEDYYLGNVSASQFLARANGEYWGVR